MKALRYFITHRITVYVFVFLLVIVGLSSYFGLPREATPDIEIPYIFISTFNRGVSPKDIEANITIPLENKLQELNNVKHMTSNSFEGFSQIIIEFYPNIKIDDALQKVKDQVDKAIPELPQDVDAPDIKDFNFSDFPVVIVNLSNMLKPENEYEQELISEGIRLISEQLEEDLEKIQGVQEVEVVGSREREIKVEFDPYKLNSYNVPPMAVIQKIVNENADFAAGNIETDNFKYSIRVKGEFETKEDVENLLVFMNEGNPIYLKDIAEIKFGFKDRESIARLDGTESVSLLVKKRAGENLIRIVDEAEEILDDYRERIKKKGFIIRTTSDQSEWVEQLVEDLENNILTGLILVVLSVFLFLGVRNAVFVSVAVPLSMLISFFILVILNITLNMVVLFSLILALGMLVDNAIVVVENIYRFRQMSYTPNDASVNATGQVALPIIASTATTVAAFFSLLFWPGIMGKFMGFLPATVIITLSASLFVALVLNPVFCASFMKVKKSQIHEEKIEKGKFLKKYSDFLRLAIRNKFKTLIISFAVLIFMTISFGVFNAGVVLFPTSEPKNFEINVTLAQGKTLDATLKEVKKIEKIIASYKGDVKHYVSNIGQNGSHKATISVELYDMQDRIHKKSNKVIDEIRTKINEFRTYDIGVNKEEMGPPTGKPINIEISGDDYETLGQIAKNVTDIVEQVPGIVDLGDDYESGRPEMKIVVDKQKASMLGISTSDIGWLYKACYGGVLAGVYRTGDEEIDIRVIAKKEFRKDFHVLDQIRLVDSQLNEYPLSSLVRRDLVGGSGVIKRIDQKWVVTVSSDVEEGYIPNNLLMMIGKKLKDKINLPAGYDINFTGEQEEQKEASDFLSKALFVSIFLIILVLVTQFNSLAVPLIIISTVILSLVGVFFGLLVTQMPFSIIMTGVGVISLAGVVVNNAIVLIDYIHNLKKEGLPLEEALVEAGATRFRPVIMTAITTILGLIPMAVGASLNFRDFTFTTESETAQWWGPMAIAIIFGLAFATVLTLIVVPTMYALKESTKNRLSKIKSKLRSMNLKSIPGRLIPKLRRNT